MRTRKARRVTQESYNQLKELLSIPGIKVNHVVSISGWSYPTVARVRSSKNFEDFQAITHPPKAPETERTETVTINSVATPTVKQTDPSTLELLNRIANSLERLAEAWESQPKKTGLFS